MGVKDYWNTQAPVGDHAVLGYYDHPTLAALLNVLYPGAFPNLAAYSGGPAEHPSGPRRRAAHRRSGRALRRASRTTRGRRKADMLRLNVAIKPVAPDPANILGVVGGDAAGFPNGRRVFDDVVSIELKAVAGALLGDVVKSFKPDAAAGASTTSAAPLGAGNGGGLTAFGLSYRDSFPYLADPWDGFDNPSAQNMPVAG